MARLLAVFLALALPVNAERYVLRDGQLETLPEKVEDLVVLDAVPTIKVVTSAEHTVRVELEPEQREDARVRIVIRDGKLIWDTGGGHELNYHESGSHHFFIDPLGGGYVEVGDYRTKAEAGFLKSGEPPIVFMWHSRRWGLDFRTGAFHSRYLLETVTYFGVAKEFNPPDVGP